VACVVLSVATGCSPGGSSADDPAAVLADRVQDVLTTSSGGRVVAERLEAFGVDLAADELAAATPRCPRVEDPEPGDEATCRLTVGDHELELVVEFGADGSIELVDAVVAP
jgi:hypothetical protein